MLIAFLLLLACMAIMISTSVLFPEPLKEAAKPLIWENWLEPLRGDPHGRGLGNYRVLTLFILAAFAVLYWLFR